MSDTAEQKLSAIREILSMTDGPVATPLAAPHDPESLRRRFLASIDDYSGLFEVLTPVPGGRRFSFTPDALRFLVVESGEQELAPNLELIVNWPDALAE